MSRNKILVPVFLSALVLASCNNRNNETDATPGMDTSVNVSDTRRNTDDTSNFLTDTTANNTLDTSRSR